MREKGLTLVPTRLYFKDGKVKVEIALARGKERVDKRRDDRRPRREASDGARAQVAAIVRAHDHDSGLQHVAVLLVQTADRLVPHLVRRLQRVVAVPLRPRDLRRASAPRRCLGRGVRAARR